MCRPVNCRNCGKTTWAGCGQHVDQVMSGVSKGNRCPGNHTSEEVRAAKSPGVLSRLFSR